MKTYAMKYKEIMTIFGALQKFAVKKRADISVISSINKKIFDVMENPKAKEEELAVKHGYFIPELDENNEPKFGEDGKELGFYDDTRRAEMLVEIGELDKSIDINNSERKFIIKALEKAMSMGLMEGPINAEICGDIFTKLEEE